MKSNIYKMLEDFFDETIVNIAKKLGYSEDNIIILESDEKKLKDQYPEIYNNLVSCNHNRDSRSLMEYAQDLICSWIFEDYLLLNLNFFGLDIKLNGEDRNRKILKSSKISSNSDYYIEYNGKKAFIELANDYKGYWKKNNICDLRDDKYNHIKKKTSDINYSLLIGIDFKNNSFFIIDILNKKNDIKYSQYHWAYHKPVYSILLKNTDYLKFNFENIANEIKRIMNGNLCD